MPKRSFAPPPPRIAANSDPSAWPEDALLTLPEAASLMWPRGPLTTRSLRHARKTGQLRTVTIARKIFTTLQALREMSRCDGAAVSQPDGGSTPEISFEDLVAAKLARKVLPPKK